jgi:hypothetical protein
VTTIRELWVRLGANTDKAQVQAFDKALDKVKDTGKAVAKTLAGVTAAAGGLAFGLWKLIGQTASAADAAAKGAQKYGLTTEAYQELQHAGDLAGVSIEQIGAGLKHLARTAEDAARGGKGSAQVWRQFGIDVRDGNRQLKTAEQLMAEGADKIAGMKNETEQMAAAQKLFGRSGLEMLPLLKQGSKAIEEQRREAHELGIVMSKETAASFEAYNDDLTRVRRTLQGYSNTLVIGLLPHLHGAVKGVLAWSKANREVIKTRIEAFAKRVGDGIKTVVGWAKQLDEQVQAWGGWEKVIERVSKALALAGVLKFAGQIGALTMAMGDLFAQGLLAGMKKFLILFAKPILIGLALAAVIAAIVLAVQDFIVYTKGGESQIGRFLERFKQMEQLHGVVMSIGRAVQAFGKMALAWGALLWKGWSLYFGLIWKIVEPILEGLGKLIMGVWTNFTLPVLELMANGFEWVFSGATKLIEWLTSKLEGAMAVVEKVMAGIAKANDLAGKLNPANAAKGVFSRVSQAFAPTADNNPRTQPRQNTMNSNATVNVTVNAETNASPAEIAAATSQKASEELARQNRLAAAAFSGGEL